MTRRCDLFENTAQLRITGRVGVVLKVLNLMSRSLQASLWTPADTKGWLSKKGGCL